MQVLPPISVSCGAGVCEQVENGSWKFARIPDSLWGLGKERGRRCGFVVNDANEERANKSQKMGSMEKCIRSKCFRVPEKRRRGCPPR